MDSLEDFFGKNKPRKDPFEEEYFFMKKDIIAGDYSLMDIVLPDPVISLKGNRPRNKSRNPEPEEKIDKIFLRNSYSLSLQSLSKSLIKNNTYSIEKISKISENKEYYGLEKYIIKKMPAIVRKNFQYATSTPKGFNFEVKDSRLITAENLGEFALPIVEYIRETKPDFIVASDRGARLLGLAVHRLYGELYGRLPTSDGTIRFRRFSKSNAQKDTEKHIRPLVDEMLRHKKKPVVLVLDDWVCSGGTKTLAQTVFDRLSKNKVDMRFGVMLGSGGDVSGHDQKTSNFAGTTDWHDDSEIIGVRYEGRNYSNSGVKASPVRSEQAKDYRRRVYKGIDKLVRKITKEAKEDQKPKRKSA